MPEYVGHVFKNEIADHPPFVDILSTRKFCRVDDLGKVMLVKLTSGHQGHSLWHGHLVTGRRSWLTASGLLRVASGWSLVLLSRGSRGCPLELLLLLKLCFLLSYIGKELHKSEEELALLRSQLLCEIFELLCLLSDLLTLLVFHELHLVDPLEDVGFALLLGLKLAYEELRPLERCL